MRPPRVSIVLPSYDGARYLDEAVASVAEQTCKDWELLLVDDGSSDDTGARMDAWAGRDPRIRAVHLGRNRGLPAALNAGFRLARGGLFTWTSDDNAFLPGAIERMAERLEADGDVDLVYADYAWRDASGALRRGHVASTRWLPLKNVVGYCFLYRREVHEELGGFDEGLFLAEDYDFWLRASSRFRFEAIHEVLYRCRVHEASLGARRSADVLLAVSRALERHLPALAPHERAHARLQRAEQLFKRGRPREARALVERALIEVPVLALGTRHRGALASGLLGRRAARRLGLTPAAQQPAVRLFLPDSLGGVTTWNADMAAARPAGAPRLELYWIEGDDPSRARAPKNLRVRADRIRRVPHRWPRENLFSVLRRMRRATGSGPGVVVANEFFGLAYGARYGARQQLVQILHGDLPMYYDLACAFEPWVDVFVTVSARIRDELVRRLPERAADIRHLRSGVPDFGRRRPRAGGPLRLVYSGRLERAKGVLDLPAIDRRVREGGAEVAWTIVGAGPEEDTLRAGFDPAARVELTGSLDCDEARRRLLEQDVFVLPSHAEGLSLALLEAMRAGVVPVASDLASGMREVIEAGANGMLAAPEDPGAFADAILGLAKDPQRLERMSAAASARVAARHALEDSGAAFHGLLEDLLRRPVCHRPRWSRGPSRLDRTWLPGPAAGWIRAAARRAVPGPKS